MGHSVDRSELLMTVGTGLLRSADIRSPDTAMGCSPIVFFPLTQRVTGTSRELLPSEQTDDDSTVATAVLSGAAAATTGLPCVVVLVVVEAGACDLVAGGSRAVPVA